MASSKFPSDKLNVTVGAIAGRGGMGDVYSGTILDVNGSPVEVAIKVFRILSNQDPKDIEKRLKREAGVWKTLDHKYILPLIGTSEANVPNNESKQTALISPWMPNGCITKYLSSPACENDVSITLKLARQVAEGMAYLHGRDVVHGDLKGNNILIDRHQNARITDFGRAYLIENDDCSLSLMAAAAWVAPEVFDHDINNKDNKSMLTKESDVWAFGITVLELYVGSKALWGRQEVPRQNPKLLIAIVKGEKPNQAHYLRVPDKLWACLRKCWETEPTKRPTMSGLVRDLGNISV